MSQADHNAAPFATFTDGAIATAVKLAGENPEYVGKPLRLYLAGKGCDGFEYGVAFDEHLEGDITQNAGPILVVVDGAALEFIQGSTVDWVDDERGKGFLIENPNHK